MTPRAWLVAAGVVLVAFVGVWAVLPPSERAYHEKVAELQAAGEPVDFAGLAGPAAPAADNGAQALLDEWAWAKEHLPWQARESVAGPWNRPEKGDWIDAASPADLAKLADYLDEAKPCLDQIHAALAKPRLDFRAEKLTWSGFPDDRRYNAVQEADDFLGAAAVGARDEPRRLDAMADLLALATRIEHPDPIDLMVGTVHVKSAVAALRRGVESGTLDPTAARARLDGALRAAWLPRLRDAVRAERVMVVQAYRSAVYGVDFVPDARPWWKRMWERTHDSPLPRGMAEKVVVHLDALTSALAVPVSPWPSYRPAVIAAMAPAARDDAPLGDAMMVGRYTTRFVLTDAQQRLARVALALAERRAASGAYPATLDKVRDAFPADMPLDPYTEAPFAYERTATGARVSSVGRLAADPPIDDAALRGNVLVWELKR